MNKTSIEWAQNPDGSQGYTWNPITGCLNHTNGLCKGGDFPCYAYRLAHGRLKNVYRIGKRIAPGNRFLVSWEDVRYDPFYPRFWEERLFVPVNKTWEWGRQRRMVSSQHPKGIFVCDMGDLFGLGVPEEWTKRVLKRFQYAPRHRFYLLTKQPQNLIKFSPFPDNAWLGVTATSSKMFVDAMNTLYKVKAKVIYLSLEPLLEWHIEPDILYGDFKAQQLDWLIIGACTGTWRDMVALSAKYPQLAIVKWNKKWVALPRIEWLREIVEAADKAGIPVFLKDNLYPLIHAETTVADRGKLRMGSGGELRQELPK